MHWILSFVVLFAVIAVSNAATPLSVDLLIPPGPLTAHFSTPTYEAAKAAAGTGTVASGPYSNRVSLCYEYDAKGVPIYVRGTAQGWWYFEGSVSPSNPSDLTFLSASMELYSNNPVRGSQSIAGTITLSGKAADFTSSGSPLKVVVSCSPSLSSWCDDWPSTISYAPNQLFNPKASQDDINKFTTANCFWIKGTSRGTASDLLSYKIYNPTLGTTYFCKPPASQDNPNAVYGSWDFIPYAGAFFNGPYLPNSSMQTLPDSSGLITTQWAGYGFPASAPFLGNGPFGNNIGSTLILSLSDTSVYGNFCLINPKTYMVYYCGSEQYDYVKTVAPTLDLCMVNVKGPWPQVTYTLNSNSALVQSFTTPWNPKPAFQPNEMVFCYEYNSAKQPVYVRGTAQGIWYIEGPVKTSGRSVLSLYANDPTIGKQPIIGSIVMQFSATLLKAPQVISVACSPVSWCAKWTASVSSLSASLISAYGYPTEANPGSQGVSAGNYCLYNPSAPKRNPADAMISKWSSAQGTTYFCKSAVTATSRQGTGVYGSWNYVNKPSECKSRGWSSFPCKNNHGPYTSDSMTTSLPDGSGFLLTQWDGWWFSPPPYNDPKTKYGYAVGRSFFASWANVVQGTYCVYDTTAQKYQYCYPEGYTITGASSPALCQTYATPPTDADLPTLPTCKISVESSSTTPNSKAEALTKANEDGAFVGVAFGCFAAGLLMAYLYIKNTGRGPSSSSPAFKGNPMHGDTNNQL